MNYPFPGCFHAQKNIGGSQKLALFKKQMHRKKSFPYPFFFLFRLAAKFHLSPYKGGFTHIIIFFSVGGATIKCVVAKLPEYFKTCPVSPWDLISNISSWMLAQISDPVTFQILQTFLFQIFKSEFVGPFFPLSYPCHLGCTMRGPSVF